MVKIDSQGIVSTVAGKAERARMQETSKDGPGFEASFCKPTSVEVCEEPSGKDFICVSDNAYHCSNSYGYLRKVTLEEGDYHVTTISSNYRGYFRCPKVAKASELTLNSPDQICNSTLQDFSFYVIDKYDQTLSRVSFSSSTDELVVFKSTCSNIPQSHHGHCGVAVDSSENVYVVSTATKAVAVLSPLGVWGTLVLSNATDLLSPSRLLFDVESNCLFVSQEHSILKIVLPMTRQSIPDCKLIQSLGTIIDKGNGADVVITVSERKLHAIKEILCQKSLYFQRMFSTPMRESSHKSQSSSIAIHDSSFEAVRAVIFWIMFDVMILTTESDVDNIVDTFRLADSYLLNELRDKCAALLMRCIGMANVFDLLNLAEKTSHVLLKMAAVDFILENLKVARRQPKFNGINPEVMKLILSQVKL